MIHDDLDTIPKILRRNLLSFPNKIAMRKKRFGIWKEYTWSEVCNRVKNIALGFRQLGLKHGDRVVIIGNNDPEIFWTEWAVQMLRGIAVCLYVDSLPGEMKFCICDCEAKFVVAEDQEQVDKFIKTKDECPSVERCIYWDSKGMWSYTQPYLMSLSQLERLGVGNENSGSSFFEECVESCRKDDLVVIIYTSGTTGTPKGIMWDNNAFFEYAQNGFGVYPVYPWDEYVSYAPPAWIEQHMGLSAGPYFPLIVSFPEEPETLQADIREIGPTSLFYAPRQWESLASQIRVKIEDSSWWKRLTFGLALKVGYRIIGYHENSKPIPIHWKFIYYLADLLMKKVRDHFGLSRAAAVNTGGALVAPELTRFFRALGIPFCIIYGVSEVGVLSGTLPTDWKYGTIGKPFPNVELKVENNELCFRSTGFARGYWKSTEGFKNKIKDGWFHTGDAGWIDKDGDIIYLDRIEELIQLKDGSRFSPQFIETKLRFSQYVKDGIVFGGEERDYIVAIVGIDFDMLGKWAEVHNISYTTFLELSNLPQVLETLVKEIKKINEIVPDSSKIRKFVSLHKAFDADESELTRSRKLKRSFLAEKYKEITDAMYDGRDHVTIEASVVYRDGRSGVTKCTLSIQSLS